MKRISKQLILFLLNILFYGSSSAKGDDIYDEIVFGSISKTNEYLSQLSQCLQHETIENRCTEDEYIHQKEYLDETENFRQVIIDRFNKLYPNKPYSSNSFGSREIFKGEDLFMMLCFLKESFWLSWVILGWFVQEKKNLMRYPLLEKAFRIIMA